MMTPRAEEAEGHGRVLIVDDEPFNLDLLRQELESRGYEIEEARSGAEALRRAAAQPPDAILLDIMMPGLDGVATCRRLAEEPATQGVPVIFMTALSDLRTKVRAFEAGGADYVTKPFEPEEVAARLRTHIGLRRAQTALAEQNRRLAEEIERNRRARRQIAHLEAEIRAELGGEMIGAAPSFRAALFRLGQVAPTDATVLVTGETGTGKELFARAIHAQSRRRDRPLIRLNCATLPRELIESELFGHEEGAFTGATRGRRGRFELAEGGTLFLDEVAELSPEAQAKLLRVLQEREFERVGGSRSLSVDVRIVAATNKDLGLAVQSGRFRDDLLYRLDVFPIRVPPLRERREDIAPLARHFAAACARRLGRSFEDIAPATLRALEGYSWPGNVRELQNIVHRATILSPGDRLELAEPLGPGPRGPAGAPAAPPPGTLAELDRAHIGRVLAETDFVIEGQGGAAARLGLNPSTLRARMRKLGIARPMPGRPGSGP